MTPRAPEIAYLVVGGVSLLLLVLLMVWDAVRRRLGRGVGTAVGERKAVG
jgi:hypothetical protein